MSSIVVAGDTSGSITLSAPAVAGSTVLTLPVVTATLITDSSGVLAIGANQIYKDASGNVGIGTSSPSGRLHVNGGYAGFQYNSSGIYPSYNTWFSAIGHNFQSGASYMDFWNTVGSGFQWHIQSGASTQTPVMTIDPSGNVGIGNTNPDVRLHVTAPNPTQGILAHLTNSTTTATTGAYLQITNAGIADWGIGQPAGATPALSFRYGTNISSAGTEFMRIDSSGKVLVTSPAGLGYGTGSGGTVTQATSKTTAVTLNKPSGQIIMNGASIPAGGSVYFALGNNVFFGSAGDICFVSNVSGDGSLYECMVTQAYSGVINIKVTNVSASPQAHALVLNFVIIKGASA
jgi:hypothetical protein